MTSQANAFLRSVGFLFALLAGSTAAQAASFQTAGDLPGGGVLSQSSALSGDGQTLVGLSLSTTNYEGFRWEVPADFNIAHWACRRWAVDRHRMALYWEDEAGSRRAFPKAL